MTRPKSGTRSPLTEKQRELAEQEADLRRQMDDLERLIAQAPKRADEERERQRQIRVLRATTKRSPFDAPDILEDHRHAEDVFEERPRRPRRAQRRAARMRLVIVGLLVLALASVVIWLLLWLTNHL
jgi:Flp pilus assembly protein TadB